MIRVVLPGHLRTLARVDGEIHLELQGPVTQRTIVDSLEEQFPALKGTIRDRQSKNRRPLVRFYACEEDWTNRSPDEQLPDDVVEGKQPYLIIGAMAGG